MVPRVVVGAGNNLKVIDMEKIKILKDVVLSINEHAVICVKGQEISTRGINSEQLLYAINNGYAVDAKKVSEKTVELTDMSVDELFAFAKANDIVLPDDIAHEVDVIVDAIEKSLEKMKVNKKTTRPSANKAIRAKKNK